MSGICGFNSEFASLVQFTVSTFVSTCFELSITSSLMSATNLRKRRGVAKASITRLDTRLKTLESATDQPTTRDSARQLSAKLKEYDAEFKTAHLSLVDLIDDEDALKGEQAALDAHEDFVASLVIRIDVLLACVESLAGTKIDERKLLSRRLKPQGVVSPIPYLL